MKRITALLADHGIYIAPEKIKKEKTLWMSKKMIPESNTTAQDNTEQGFTLLELLISMVIGMIIIAVMPSSFILQRNEFDDENLMAEAVQNTRAAIDMMTREIRMAGFDPTGAVFDGIIYDASQLRFLSDLNGDGATNGSNEDITYKYVANAKQIQRKTGSGNFEPMVENIEELIFEYLDENGNSTTVSEDVRQIRLAITAVTREPITNQGYKTVTIENKVMARNLSYR